MAYEVNELKPGITVTIDKDIFVIVTVDHVKPGKGSAIARTKLRNLRLGTIIERTFRTGDTLQEAYIEPRKLQYSYRSDTMYHFLDQETYEDIAIEQGKLGETRLLLKEELEVTAYFYQNELVNIVLPTTLSYAVTHTEPGIKGDTAKNTLKAATIETGATIQVPLFVNVGDRIKIDTRTWEYIGRENENVF